MRPVTAPGADRPQPRRRGHGAVHDLVGTVATSVVVTLALVISTRILAEALGPDGYGAYSVARRVLQVVLEASTVPFGIAIARAVAMAPSTDGERDAAVSGLMGVLAVAAPVGFVLAAFPSAIARLAFGDAAYARVIVAVAVLFAGYVGYSVLYAYHRGRRMMRAANLWQMIVQGATPLVVAVLAIDRPAVSFVLVALAVPLFAGTFQTAGMAWRSLRQQAWRRLVEAARSLTRFALPRIPTGFALGAIYGVGPFLAGNAGALAQAGYIAAGQSLLGLMQVGSEGFGLIALPRVARAIADGRHDELRAGLASLLAFTRDFGLYMTLHLWIWGDRLVYALLGPQFGEAVLVVRVVLLAAIPSLAYTLLRSVVDAADERAINTRNLMWAACVGAPLSGVAMLAGNIGVWLAAAFVTALVVLCALTVRSVTTRLEVALPAGGLGATVALTVGTGAVAMAVHAMTRHMTGWLPFVIAAAFEAVCLVGYVAVMWRFGTPWVTDAVGRLRAAFAPVTSVR